MPAKRISSALFFLLSTLIAVGFAHLAWAIIELSSPAAPLTAQTAGASRTATSAENAPLQQAINTLKANPLFGKANVQSTAVAKPVINEQDIRQTRLNIQLLGLIYGEPSVAVISFEGKEGAYRIGEPLGKEGGRDVSLASVEQDHVIIYNNGVPEKLLLPKATEQRSSVARASSPSASEEAINISLSSSRITRLIGNDPKNTLMNNPLSLSKYMMLSPQNEQGALKGYRITPGPDKRLMAITGIRNGDLITHVDNTPISSLDLPSLYQILQSANSLSLTVERNGQPINMDITL